MGEGLKCVWDWLGNNAGAFIASIALIVAVCEARRSRRHNRLSVRPELIQRSDASVECRRFRLFVINAGLGPARILSFGFVYKKEPFKSTAPQDVCTFLDNLFNDVAHVNTVELLYPRSVMSQNERCDVLEVRFRDISDEKTRELFGRLQPLDVDIGFESLYGERDALRPFVRGGG